MELIGIGCRQLRGILGRRGLPDDLELGVLPEHVGQALAHQADGQVGDVDPDPLAAQLLGGGNGSPAAAEGVEHHVAGVGAGLDDAFQEGEGLLGRISKALCT